MGVALFNAGLSVEVMAFLDGLAEIIAEDMLRRQEDEGQDDERDGGQSLSARKRRNLPNALHRGGGS